MDLRSHSTIADWLRPFGIVALLVLEGDDVATLDETDLAAMRELGLTAPMLDSVRDLARVPGRRLVLDFDQQIVSVEGDIEK